MKQYLLLRDGQESGPYSLEAVEMIELKSLDLVWVVGESVTWQYPDEVEELKPFINTNQQAHSIQTSLIHSSELNYRSSSRRTMAGFLSGASFALVILSVAIIAAIFITKDWSNKPQGNSAMKKTAAKDGFIIPEEAAASISNDFRNAITKEIVPVEDSAKKIKKEKPKNLKKLVSLESNADYKVGIFGGIKNLKLTINNNSDVLLEKVTIRINYLKRNGEVIHNETLSAKKIEPQSTQTIDVAPSTRGVKVSYKVISVETDETEEVALRNL